jgi:hypothetical protein
VVIFQGNIFDFCESLRDLMVASGDFLPKWHVWCAGIGLEKVHFGILKGVLRAGMGFALVLLFLILTIDRSQRYEIR